MTVMSFKDETENVSPSVLSSLADEVLLVSKTTFTLSARLPYCGTNEFLFLKR